MEGAFDHASLVSDSDKLVATLNTVKCDLSDDFIEALRVELLTNGTDTLRASSQVVQLFVKSLLKVQYVGTRGWRG